MLDFYCMLGGAFENDSKVQQARFNNSSKTTSSGATGGGNTTGKSPYDKGRSRGKSKESNSAGISRNVELPSVLRMKEANQYYGHKSYHCMGKKKCSMKQLFLT